MASLESVQALYASEPAILATLSGKLSAILVPVYCQWEWSSDFIDMGEDHSSLNPPQSYLGFIPTPFMWAKPAAPERPKKPQKPVATEKSLELELVEWLHAHGVKADNQVATARHRTDIWIPGHCFLELKRAKISGDDVCQAIDYCSEYKKPVVLIGNHISEMASRGIEAFNKVAGSEMIVFISWSASKTYLKGLLSLSSV